MRKRPLWTVVEALDRNYYRVRGPQGRISVVQLFECSDCSTLVMRKGDICTSCAIEKQKEQKRVDGAIRLQQCLKVTSKRRYAMQVLASPEWRDRKKINALYEEAERLTAETGIVHHVDHIYPIQGIISCGLHVHQNLRVLPATENCSKSNGHPMHESPALASFIKEYGEAGFRKWIGWFRRELKFISGEI